LLLAVVGDLAFPDILSFHLLVISHARAPFVVGFSLLLLLYSYLTGHHFCWSWCMFLLASCPLMLLVPLLLPPSLLLLVCLLLLAFLLFLHGVFLLLQQPLPLLASLTLVILLLFTSLLPPDLLTVTGFSVH
jgi:hypothetical protein